MSTMSRIQEVPINIIHRHPDNPRKELGDLTELADSIRENGIMQNLTVVSDPVANGEYMVVIGHRRLAAAKLAGMETVPCVVTQMTYQRQVATMLAENMQRSDLTLIEQAEGIQLMLNLGENVESVSEKTGLSQSTVRRRLKLTELDSKLLREADSRGGTMRDYIELDKLKDPDNKNKVLRTIGTADFKNALAAAKAIEEAKEKIGILEAVISTFAEKVTDCPEEARFERSYYSSIHGPNNITVPQDEKKRYYKVESYNAISVYYAVDKAELEYQEIKQAESDKRRRELTARLESLKEIETRHSHLIVDFALNWDGKNSDKMMAYAAVKAIEGCIEADDAYSLIGLPNYEDLENEDDEMRRGEQLREYAASAPERTLLIALVSGMPDSRYFTYTGEHRNNEDMNEFYAMLESIGYEMSAEEKAMQDGSHEVFKSGN